MKPSTLAYFSILTLLAIALASYLTYVGETSVAENQKPSLEIVP